MVKTLKPSSKGSVGVIPDGKAEIPYASWPKHQNRKQKKCCNRVHEDLKMVHIKKQNKQTKKTLKINKQKL